MDETPPYAWSETRAPQLQTLLKQMLEGMVAWEANSMAIKGEKADVPVSSA
jgi:hypothetical protein